MTNIAKVWEVFREQIEGEDEVALLFQCGTYDFYSEIEQLNEIKIPYNPIRFNVYQEVI